MAAAAGWHTRATRARMWLSMVASRVDTACVAELAAEGDMLPVLPGLAKAPGWLLMCPWLGGGPLPAAIGARVAAAVAGTLHDGSSACCAAQGLGLRHAPDCTQARCSHRYRRLRLVQDSLHNKHKVWTASAALPPDCSTTYCTGTQGWVSACPCDRCGAAVSPDTALCVYLASPS